MACHTSFFRQRGLLLFLLAKLVTCTFYMISSVSAAGTVGEKNLLPCTQISSHGVEGTALTTAPDADSPTKNEASRIKYVHTAPQRLISNAKDQSGNFSHQGEEGDWAFRATLRDRPGRTKDHLDCQEKHGRALQPKMSVLTASLKNKISKPRADARSGGDHPLHTGVRKEEIENPAAPTPKKHPQNHRKVLQSPSFRVKHFQDGRNSRMRRLAGGWGGYPAYLSWYRTMYLPWYYRMYGAAANPPLPTSPVVTALYQANVIGPQAAFVNAPVTAPSFTGPLTIAPVISTPVAATAASVVPAASVGVIPAVSPVPTEALLSLQDASTGAIATAVPATGSTPAALATASGAYGLVPSGTVATPAMTTQVYGLAPSGTVVTPAMTTQAYGVAPSGTVVTPAMTTQAYGLAPSGTVVTPAMTTQAYGVAPSGTVVTPAMTALAQPAVTSAPVTFAAPTAVAVPAATSSAPAVASPVATVVPVAYLPRSALLGTPASVAALPTSTAVPAFVSAPVAASELPMRPNASRFSNRLSGGVAGLGVANFAAFLARPDGTMAAVGGTGE